MFSSEDPPEPEPPPLLPPTRIFFLRILWILEASWIVCRVSLWWLGSGDMWARSATCNMERLFRFRSMNDLFTGLKYWNTLGLKIVSNQALLIELVCLI